MRHFLLCFSMFALPALAVEPSWLTVVGDPGNANIDTVQVDVASIMGVGDLKLIKVRASRQTIRTSPMGIKFRSFESISEVDCNSRAARYVRTSFFSDPLWKSPIQTVDYGTNAVSMMVFRDMQPNPSEKIVRAACMDI